MDRTLRWKVEKFVEAIKSFYTSELLDETNILIHVSGMN